MSGEHASSRWPRSKHVVRTVHTGAKHLLTNFDAFSPAKMETQGDESRFANRRSGATYVHMPSVGQRNDTGDHHYKKQAGNTLYLKINCITQWKVDFASSVALYEPSLDAFQSVGSGEQLKVNILRIVYREDDQAWWHVQEHMWNDNLKNPFKIGEKVAGKVNLPVQQRSPIDEQAAGVREFGKVSKPKIPWPTNGHAEKGLEPAAKRRRRLPWVTDQPAQKGRKAKGAKINHEKSKKSWNPGVDSLSDFLEPGDILIRMMRKSLGRSL